MAGRYDAAVVGAGILGLAHAYQLARRGRRVVVFERGPRATGASIRNFGMLWPIGQPPGRLRTMAEASLRTWLTVLRATGLWHEQVGSLHLAYRDDEAAVLAEFAAAAPSSGSDCELLDPRGVLARSPAVNPTGLLAGLWSAAETCVDPREVAAGLPPWLAEQFGVTVAWNTAVTGFEPPVVIAGGERWQADRLFLCGGDDVVSLFPGAFTGSGLERCKLQMLRSEPLPRGWRLGPMLAGGLTLRHYAAFRGCRSLAALQQRVAAEMGEYDRYGIHVMVTQNGAGELVIGDSHEYGDAVHPFDRPAIDELILRYLHTFLAAPGFSIGARWHGAYLRHPASPYWIAQPAPGATIVTGVGGAGMTLSFGLADQVVRGALGEDPDGG
jgi:FAD dependent oxidoreductase TIGR03364